MSNSLLYHAFGLRGYHQQRTDFHQGRVTFTVAPKKPVTQCPNCDSENIQRRGHVERTWQTVSIGSKPVFVRMNIPRIHCHDCGTTLQVPVPFAPPQRGYTHALERYVLELRGSMTVKDVAIHLRIHQGIVKDIDQRYLERRFDKPRLKDLQRIAVDEISVGKGHRYVTVVLDLDSGAVVHVGEGKDGKALEPFWTRLKASHARVKAVAMDMSTAYISAALEHLPDAEIVFDRFHLMKLYNEKLSGLRRELYREATEGLGKEVLKGSRWLLLKNMENLDDEKNERHRLQEALRLNQSLATAYYMKEELRLFWEQSDMDDAERFLEDWCARAECSGIRMLQKFAKTLRSHRYGLLSWYSHPISTGPLEGTNNKIKTMKRQAYGYRDQEYFRLRLYGLHETRYELVG
jgi:transposase